MRCLSIGDCVQTGAYRLHSAFDKAINYCKQGQGDCVALTLALPVVGNAPVNVVLDNLPDSAPEELQFKNGIISNGKGGVICLCTTSPVYNTAVQNAVYPLFSAMCSALENTSFEYPPDSLAFLLFPAYEANFKTGFQQAFCAQIKTGVALLEKGDMESGARKLRGAGVGLTPSGDDFLCGFMGALSLCGKVDNAQMLYAAAIGNNAIVNGFYHSAVNGRFSARVKDVLHALSTKDNSQLKAALNRLLAVGATSGADYLAGLLRGLGYIQRNNG